MKILQCEGYKMFEGTAKIVPLNEDIKPFEMTGTWLYKPQTNCWYCNSRSFPEVVVKVEED